MSDPKAQLAKLPQATRTRLDELKSSLEKALGADLVSLLVHGSAIRGGFREKDSDVDVVVVLSRAPREKLEAIGNALHVARNAARIECMILVEEEIAHAADAFPLFYDDIKRCHLVLAGSDPFANLAISRAHLRVRIEQELREAQIRLRRAVTDARGAKELLAGAVLRKVRQIRSPLRALLGLRGDACEDDLASVLAAAAKAYDLDTKSLGHVHEAPDAAHAELVLLLAAAIADVDAREEGT
jgi:predicted nucleotidyltransferase